MRRVNRADIITILNLFSSSKVGRGCSSIFEGAAGLAVQAFDRRSTLHASCNTHACHVVKFRGCVGT
jgi:hypothetical protein